MQMLQRKQQLRTVKATPILIKLLFLLKMMEQLSTIHKRQDEIEFCLWLEGDFERDDEGIIDFC